MTWRRRASSAGTRPAAAALGDPQLAARAIAAFTVPAIWTTNDDDALSARIVEVAERALAADGLPEVDRGRLLVTIAMERRADSGGRGEQAARDAEAIARRRADPVLLAAALNGRFLQTFHRAGLAAQRGRIGAELVDLAHRHGLVTYEVLGHLIQLQSRRCSRSRRGRSPRGRSRAPRRPARPAGRRGAHCLVRRAAARDDRPPRAPGRPTARATGGCWKSCTRTCSRRPTRSRARAADCWRWARSRRTSATCPPRSDGRTRPSPTTGRHSRSPNEQAPRTGPRPLGRRRNEPETASWPTIPASWRDYPQVFPKIR